MNTDIDTNKLNSFWQFVETVGYDSNSSDAESVRKDFLKRISPHNASTYKEICDKLAYALFDKVTTKSIPLFLYASYEAVAKGSEFYNLCLSKPETVVTLSTSINAFNHFGNCLPTEDDYFAQNTSYVAVDYIDEDEEDDDF